LTFGQKTPKRTWRFEWLACCQIDLFDGARVYNASNT